MVVQGKFSPFLSNQDKQKAWTEIVDALAASFPHVRRTLQECETRWFTVLSKTRRKISANNKEYNQTGKTLFNFISAQAYVLKVASLTVVVLLTLTIG